jgi:hypothetical protein
LASKAFSPAALSPANFSSLARSFIAARSSAVNPLDVLPLAVVLLPDFFVAFFGLTETSSVDLYRLGLETSPQSERGPTQF